jgi:hypothetical protein
VTREHPAEGRGTVRVGERLGTVLLTDRAELAELADRLLTVSALLTLRSAPP